MLVNFRVENYKSFKDFTEFSMQATKLKNLKDSNTFEVNNISLLKSCVVYGANASGKSNLLHAMKEMKEIIISSISMQKNYKHKPFLLNTETEHKPTIFEIEFILDELLYRYGFSLETDLTIVEEWLYQKKLQPRAREIMLFKRKNQEITISSQFKEGKNLKEKTRTDVLFLSVVAEFNGEITLKIMSWLKQFKIFSSLKNQEFKNFSFFTLQSTYKSRLIKLLNSADLAISDVFVKNMPKKVFEELVEKQDEKLEKEVQTIHLQYDKDNKFKQYKLFDLENESEGTRRFLSLLGPILITLDMGKILIIDELDNSLHTELVRAIIKLFNSKETNPNNAQLIFTTHDTNVLDQSLFRRDQIWFTEKDIYGASDLYSLVEYGKGSARNDLALEKNYLDGKFGAKPNIGTLAFEVD